MLYNLSKATVVALFGFSALAMAVPTDAAPAAEASVAVAGDRRPGNHDWERVSILERRGISPFFPCRSKLSYRRMERCLSSPLLPGDNTLTSISGAPR
jgi:hypothetical protein